MACSGELIMASLINLSPAHFSDLAHSLSSDLRLQHHRLLFLLLSPSHFSQTLSFLHSLSLPHKTLLLARLLLRSLSKLLPTSYSIATTAPPAHCHRLRLHELDAALLLLIMVEIYDPKEIPGFDWREKIANHLLQTTLSTAGLGGAQRWGVVSKYVDAAAKCRRLLEAVTGEAGKKGREVAAAVAVVVGLPSVEVVGEGRECAVCKEEIMGGREVCGMPCGHLFHWMCILPWLRRRNTCPCCRFELPTDDVFCEIERLWRSVGGMCGGGGGGVP